MSVAKPEGYGIVAEKLGAWIADINTSALPDRTVDIARLLLLDVTGLCIAGRAESYMRATLQATDAGACSALAHARGFSAFDAALAWQARNWCETVFGEPALGALTQLRQ
jgi:hypothetical protein